MNNVRARLQEFIRKSDEIMEAWNPPEVPEEYKKGYRQAHSTMILKLREEVLK